MIEFNGLSMLTFGNVTKEQETNPVENWLDLDAGFNVDVLALSTYGMASSVVLLDRWVAPVHTDIDSTTTTTWVDEDKTTGDTWQDQDATT